MDPFLSNSALDRGSMLTDAVVGVLDARGVLGLTVTAVAREIGITPQAITMRLGLGR